MKQIRVSNLIRELSHAFETLILIFIEIKVTEIFGIYLCTSVQRNQSCRSLTAGAITVGSPTKIDFPRFF